MKCNYSLVHGRQATRRRGDYGLIELLITFEDGRKSYLSTKTYVLFRDWHKQNRTIVPTSDDFDYAVKRIDGFIEEIKDLELRATDFSPEDLRNGKRAAVMSGEKPGSLNLTIQRIIYGVRRKSQATIDNYYQALSKLNEFNPDIPMTMLDKAPMRLAYDLDSFLFDQGLAPTTIDKIHSIFRTLFTQAYEMYQNVDGYKDPYDSWEFTGNTKENVFLSEDDIIKIAELSFDNTSEQGLIRDAFLLSYYTGVRYSDLDKLVHDNIRVIGDREVFTFFPKKSTVFNKKPKKAVVPITANIRRLLDKYGWVFPTPGEYLLRKHVRTVCACAGLNQDFTFIKYEGSETKEVTVPLYHRITIHTARRSAINNMHKAGIPSNVIMRLTGHKSEASLMAYINADTREDQEIASLLTNEYFN